MLPVNRMPRCIRFISLHDLDQGFRRIQVVHQTQRVKSHYRRAGCRGIRRPGEMNLFKKDIGYQLQPHR